MHYSFDDIKCAFQKRKTVTVEGIVYTPKIQETGFVLLLPNDRRRGRLFVFESNWYERWTIKDGELHYKRLENRAFAPDAKLVQA